MARDQVLHAGNRLPDRVPVQPPHTVWLGGVAWPLCALVSLSKAWAAVRMNWVETREELQKVPHTVNSQETIDSLTTWMLCYGWWTSWNWIPSLVVSSPVPVSIYIIAKERLDPDCRLYVSVSGSCAISGVGGRYYKVSVMKRLVKSNTFWICLKRVSRDLQSSTIQPVSNDCVLIYSKCIYILIAQRTYHGQMCASYNSQNIFISIILAEAHEIHANGKASI